MHKNLLKIGQNTLAIYVIHFIILYGSFTGLGVYQFLKYSLSPTTAIIGALLNIVLDLAFVYGIKGFIPAMNIEGAAYASVIAQITMAIIAVVLLLKKTDITLKISYPFHKEIPRLLGMIANLFVRTIALNTALYFATSYATDYGKEYIAAYTIGINIWLLGAFMIDGYSSAGNILSGKFLGAKDYNSLVTLSNKLFKYGLITGIIIAIIGAIFYNFIGQIFTKDAAVLEQFYHVFWIVLLTQPISAITFIFDGMFKGMGFMKYLRNLLILSTGLVFIPTLLFFDWLDYKLYAIWIAFTLWILARGIPLIIKFRSQFLPLISK